MARVLVTGGGGFIAGHCILALVAEGHEVRMTARSTTSGEKARQRLASAGADVSRLEVAVADLGDDAGWGEAMAGCEAVLHVASPIPHGDPSDPDEVVRPAVDGTLRVVRAARDAGVRRLVLTSAFGSVGFGRGPSDHEFTEEDWTPLDAPGVSVYNRSKTLAEQAAWRFAAENPDLELVVLNPVAVFGPLLGSEPSGGNGVVAQMLAGRLPVMVDLWFPVVDVRDVAQAELRALTSPAAAGHRIIISSGEGLTMAQIASLLRGEFGDRAAKVPHGVLPTWVVKAAARFNPVLREAAPELGFSKRISTRAQAELLGLRPRPARDAVLACARSLLELA